MIPQPTIQQLIALDDELTELGVNVFHRPLEAAKIWGDRHGSMLAGIEKEAWFKAEYRRLHSSVDFSAASFLTLAVAARGVSYSLKPPMAYGHAQITPIEHVGISDFELRRLFHDFPCSFWELHWQAVDGIDLFMARVNFHSKVAGAENRLETAINQLTASARQLIASEIDSSLPQGVAMACELAGKAVLLALGESPSKVKALGHDLVKIHTAMRALNESPFDDALADVIISLPKYVEVRYESPQVNIREAQNIYRKAVFVVADFIRRINHDQLYWKITDMPERDFKSLF